jgi:hypothetical protein
MLHVPGAVAVDHLELVLERWGDERWDQRIIEHVIERGGDQRR